MTSPLFPMRAVVLQTGITPDTLRVWERRHGAVTPVRTPGGARRYSGRDVRRLILMREAIARGHAIGGIAHLSEDDLVVLAGGASPDLPSRSPDSPARFAASIDAFLAAVRAFDVPAADGALAAAAALASPQSFALGVAVPVLRRMGDGWARGELTVAHEHFGSARIQARLEAELDRIDRREPGARTLVAASPEGHAHSLGVLVGALLAATRGWSVVWLGASVPAGDLAAAVRSSGAARVLLGVARSLTRPETDRLADDVATLLRTPVEVWIGLPAGSPAEGRLPGAQILGSFEELARRLDEQAAPTAR